MMVGPGPMVAGPGPGVMHMTPAGGDAPGSHYGVTTTSQLRFIGPDGMSVGWQIMTGPPAPGEER